MSEATGLTIGHLPAPDVCTLPSWQSGGILPARRFEIPSGQSARGRTALAPQGVEDFYGHLLHLVARRVPGTLALNDGGHGTIGGRVTSAPVESGEWHRDSGDHALRVVVTWAPELPDLKVGHEFRDRIAASGEVVAFTNAEHRRPCVSARTGRIFVSVSLYEPHVEADLSCPLLVELR